MTEIRPTYQTDTEAANIARLMEILGSRNLALLTASLNDVLSAGFGDVRIVIENHRIATKGPIRKTEAMN